MATQTINGATIHYLEKGRGPALVLLHGFPLSSGIWEGQLNGLSDRYRVIAPDLRGFGQSPVGENFTLEQLADDIHGLLEKLGALPCVLAGLSMGGYVALDYVRKYPTDLRGLVLVDTKAAGDTPEARHNREQMADTAVARGAKAVSEQMMPKMLADGTCRDRPQVVEQLRTIMEGCPPRTIACACLAMRDRPDHTASLPSIPVPTMVVVGESDALIPVSVAQGMTDAIPRCELVVIPKAGHLTSMEQPEALNQALREFMERLPVR